MKLPETLSARIAQWAARKLLRGDYWRLKVTAFCLALVLCFAPPHLRGLIDYLQKVRPAEAIPRHPDLDRMDAMRVKIAHPFMDMRVYFTPDRQEAKRTFRITVPLAARLLHLNIPATLFLGTLSGPVIFFGILVIAGRFSKRRLFATGLAIFAAALYFGQSCFSELGGCFDAWGYAFLVLAMIARNPVWVTASVLAGCFTDERILAASPAVALYHWLDHRRLSEVKFVDLFKSRVLAVAGAWVVCLTGRFAISTLLRFPPGAYADCIYLKKFDTYAYCYFYAFFAWKFGLLLFLAGIWRMLRERPLSLFLPLFLFGFFFAVAIALSALDTTRGLNSATPYFLVLLAGLVGIGSSDRVLLRWIWPAALASLLVPNVHYSGEICTARCLPAEVVILLKWFFS